METGTWRRIRTASCAANNNGLLVFDGATWRNYPLPNKTIVRSLAMGEEGRIYVGGQGEFGYFAPDKTASWLIPLKNLLPAREHDFC